MNKRSLFFFTTLVLLSLALTFLQIPVASSQGPVLVASKVKEKLPIADPDSALWGKATALDVPLSAQNIAKPMLLQTTVRTVTARALYNPSEFAILVEWADSTQNDQMVRIQDFRDAVAVQFPLVAGQPFVCMGQQGANVNIWHWKADWQADMAKRKDMETVYPNMNVDYYPFATGAAPAPRDYADPNYVPALVAKNLFAAEHQSPVEDIIAGTFGTLTPQAADKQNVQGSGAWANGKWRVIFSRVLASPEAEDAQFAEGKVYPLAFAAWDGANGERNGQKSTSNWVSLQVGQVQEILPGQSPVAFTILLFVMLVLAAGVFRVIAGGKPAQS